MASSDGIRQHKVMAGAAETGNFGVQPLPSGSPHPDRGMDTGKHVGDNDRSAPPAFRIGKDKMRATRHSDHGPHDHRG